MGVSKAKTDTSSVSCLSRTRLTNDLLICTEFHSVANLLKAWVREYMDHEEMNRELLLRIREFAMETMLEKGQSLQICKSVDERVRS